jgi:glycosyltransferase involved in cell wall biosynthesis
MQPSGHPPRSVALLVNNAFVSDARSWKMASTLAGSGYQVTVVARAEQGVALPPPNDAFRVVHVPQPDPLARLPRTSLLDEADDGPPDRAQARAHHAARRLHRVKAIMRATLGRGVQATRYLWLARLWAREIEHVVDGVDVWQAEEMVMLPVALALQRRCGGLVVYDAHDLDVESAGFARLPWAWRALLAWAERRWARSADALIAANDGYARVQARRWGRRPMVIWNAPLRSSPLPDREPRWHRRLGLEPDIPVVLYLGLVIRGRGIAELCEAMAFVPKAVLVVAGFGPEYESCAKDAARLGHADRIVFPGRVPHEEIPGLVASADVVAVPVQGDTLNHRLNVPTKLLDAMGAGVPVVASNLPGMARIVRSTGAGELFDPERPTDIARAIRKVIGATEERRAAYRDGGLAATSGQYGWEWQAETLRRLYADLPIPDREVPEPSQVSA